MEKRKALHELFLFFERLGGTFGAALILWWMGLDFVTCLVVLVALDHALLQAQIRVSLLSLARDQVSIAKGLVDLALLQDRLVKAYRESNELRAQILEASVGSAKTEKNSGSVDNGSGDASEVRGVRDSRH